MIEKRKLSCCLGLDKDKTCFYRVLINEGAIFMSDDSVFISIFDKCPSSDILHLVDRGNMDHGRPLH